jgi:choline-sulfatase
VRIAVVACIVSALAAAGCARLERARPNVLLVTLDTTRADHIGAYGYRAGQTPNIDALAAAGVLFERAIAAAPVTLPSHVSVFTGRYPFGHGVRNNGTFTLAGDVPTLATALHGVGYRTAAFVSAFVLDRRYGLARGFDDYDDRFGVERRAGATVSAAEAWLVANARADRPFFLWVHLYDPHDPYDPPEPFRQAFAAQPYDGEIAYADQNVGRLVSRLRQLDPTGSTVVAVAGDHGESLGEHGEATHAMFLYESALRVPLVVSAPNRLPRGRRVTAPVRAIDLAPTLLALAGVPPLPNVDGVDLRPAIEGRAGAPAGAYAETYFPRYFMNWSELRSFQDDRWKFIDAPDPELYDLAADGGEQNNLVTQQPARAAALKRALDELTRAGRPAAPSPVDRDTQRKLAALGYIGAIGGHATDDGGARPDPKAMIGVFNRLRDANTAIQQGRPSDAERAARAVLAGDSGNAFATMILARARMEQGRYEEAVAGFRRYATLVPSSADPHHWIAICLSRLGDRDRALAEADAALALDPHYAEAHALRGGLMAARGRLEAALGDLRAAVESAPDSAAFRVGYARILLSAGRPADADRELQLALAAHPDDPDARAAAGGLFAERGQFDRARTEYERALAARPSADDVRLDYADVLVRLGRRAEALREYSRLADAPDTPGSIRLEARRRLQKR